MSEHELVFSTAAVDQLVLVLNEQLDLPFVPENQEARVIRWAVNLVIPKIPEWVLPFLVSAADGLTPEDIALHEDNIVREVNRLVDVPWTPESMEEMLIRPVVHAILQYALQGNALPE